MKFLNISWRKQTELTLFFSERFKKIYKHLECVIQDIVKKFRMDYVLKYFGAKNRFVKNTVRIFSFFSVFIFIASSLPLNSYPGKSVFEQIAIKFGWTQNWSMFAPDPLKIDLSVNTIVKKKDGSVIVWKQAFFKDYFGSWRSERTRKWMESFRLDSNQHLWEPYSDFVSHQPPFLDQTSSIKIERKWSFFPHPKSRFEGWLSPLREFTPHWNQYVFYEKKY